ncbi:MAG: ankyrin repeat domain-containing protein [Bryobacterales bacterium]|nr:ankyrin repeat domain-containing protein [Bryobacterales bacterium]
MQILPFRSPLAAYEEQARAMTLPFDEACTSVAHAHDFQDWPSLAAYVAAVTADGPVYRFEAAVEAIVNGDLNSLQSLLRRDPELVHARSSRVCRFDPPVHRATLLHYIAANGVEGYRQKSPANAPEMARLLLAAGAAPDALADFYGVECTTLALLVSSSPPRDVGTQCALVEALLDYGAAVDGKGSRKWGGPLRTALTFSVNEAARLLVRRGASIGFVEAAGLGLPAEIVRMLPEAGAEERHRAFSLAAQNGQEAVVRLLLDAGEDPSRYNLPGNHAHSTPLHQSVLGGHADVVRLLVERGAQLDLRDTVYNGTALGWAIYGGGARGAEMAELLRSLGARE